jgi:cation diffusion facilitator CzcD-associated flavoprotein CzcO
MIDIEQIRAWIDRLEGAFNDGDPSSLRDLLADDATWKDLHLIADQPVLIDSGRGGTLPDLSPLGVTGVRLHSTIGPREVRRGDEVWTETILEFQHRIGTGIAVARLTETDGAIVAQELFTALDGLHGYPERIGPNRPGGNDSGKHQFGDQSWAVRRRDAARFSNRDPEVVIVGGGQAGLSLAARLIRYGVDVLVIEQNARIGDNWRNRYEALRLHNAVEVIGLPYFACPITWETYLSKDRVADWLEFYADAMDIPCWTSSQIDHASFDAQSAWWDVKIKDGQGVLREMHPRHLVMATGVSGRPRIPELPELGTYRGELLHSTQYIGGADYAGTRALVVGSGSSGHDIAQDLHEHGAQVTMLQRGSMTVASVNPATAKILDRAFSELEQAHADVLAASLPYPGLVAVHQELTREVRHVDADLHRRLEEVGFKLDFGPDETGVALKYLRNGGGFYLNVGCSDLIADGDVMLLPADRLDRFDAHGVLLTDGSRHDFDVVVFATGFEDQRSIIGDVLGRRTADVVGRVWGLDTDGFPRNVWRPTPQQGLWFMLGNFQQCRFYSKTLALQILAQLRHISIGCARQDHDASRKVPDARPRTEAHADS